MIRRKVLGVIAAALVVAGTAGCSESGGTDAGGQPTQQAGAPTSAAGDGAGEGAAGLQSTIDELLSASLVAFTPESAELSAESKETLKKIAEAAAKVKDAKLAITTKAGYEDAAKAKKLSEERLDAITAELTSAGLGKDRIEGTAEGNEKAKDVTALQVDFAVPGA